MASPFGRAIELLPTQSYGSPVARFINHFDNTQDVLNLRATSRIFGDLKQINDKAFKTIRIHTPCHGEQDHEAVKAFGPLCRNLLIKIAYPPIDHHDPLQTTCCRATRSSRRVALRNALQNRLRRIQEDHDRERAHSPDFKGQSEPEFPSPVAWKYICQRRPNQLNLEHLAHWQHIFSLFPNISTLTIACNGEPGWPGCIDIEMCLINIRICIERVDFRSLRTVVLDPIHAAGIMHFRWAGLGAYGEAKGFGPPCSGPLIPWMCLERLELRLKNPFIEGRMSLQQKGTFERVLGDYLKSFRRTLRVLKVEWIGGASGLNPLSDGKENANGYGGDTQAWISLEELWLGNIAVTPNTVIAIKGCAPVLQRLMLMSHTPLGAGDDHSGGGPATEGGLVWRDVLHTGLISSGRDVS